MKKLNDNVLDKMDSWTIQHELTKGLHKDHYDVASHEERMVMYHNLSNYHGLIEGSKHMLRASSYMVKLCKVVGWEPAEVLHNEALELESKGVRELHQELAEFFNYSEPEQLAIVFSIMENTEYLYDVEDVLRGLEILDYAQSIIDTHDSGNDVRKTMNHLYATYKLMTK